MHSKLLLWGRLLIERGAFALAPVGWIWGCAVFCKNWLYDRGWMVPARIECVVVSVGNIVAGGTGKTPFVHLLAKTFAKRRVAVLSRGYGKIPDEAILLQRRLPSARVYVGKDRAALARQAVREGAELIVLDDGFQHRRLSRDFDIVLIGLETPLGKGRYLPAGFLRDSPQRLHHADAVFVNGKDFRPHVCRVLDFESREEVDVRGWKAGLFCGIGRPESFQKTVAELGVERVAEWMLADHEGASFRGMKKFWDRCRKLGARALITTEKDAVKLHRSPCPLVFVEMEIELAEGKGRWEKLIAKIDQKIDNMPRQPEKLFGHI